MWSTFRPREFGSLTNLIRENCRASRTCPALAGHVLISIKKLLQTLHQDGVGASAGRHVSGVGGCNAASGAVIDGGRPLVTTPLGGIIRMIQTEKMTDARPNNLLEFFFYASPQSHHLKTGSPFNQRPPCTAGLDGFCQG